MFSFIALLLSFIFPPIFGFSLAQWALKKTGGRRYPEHILLVVACAVASSFFFLVLSFLLGKFGV